MAVDLSAVRGHIELLRLGENWLPVVGWEAAYLVSDQGRVWSIRRQIVLAATPVKSGHHAVKLSLGGKTKLRYVHQLVLEAHVGPRPPGLHALHDNDIKPDNRLSNLSWGTPRKNSLDAVRNGVHPMSRRQNCGNCGETLELIGAQRRCRTCQRRSAREYAQRARQRNKEMV